MFDGPGSLCLIWFGMGSNTIPCLYEGRVSFSWEGGCSPANKDTIVIVKQSCLQGGPLPVPTSCE